MIADVVMRCASDDVELRNRERLPPGTPIHLIDDLVFSGQALRSARQVLKLVDLGGTTAPAILWTHRADSAMDELAAAGMTEITCLIHQILIPG